MQEEIVTEDIGEDLSDISVVAKQIFKMLMANDEKLTEAFCDEKLEVAYGALREEWQPNESPNPNYRKKAKEILDKCYNRLVAMENEISSQQPTSKMYLRYYRTKGNVCYLLGHLNFGYDDCAENHYEDFLESFKKQEVDCLNKIKKYSDLLRGGETSDEKGLTREICEQRLEKANIELYQMYLSQAEAYTNLSQYSAQDSDAFIFNTFMGLLRLHLMTRALGQGSLDGSGQTRYDALYQQLITNRLELQQNLGELVAIEHFKAAFIEYIQTLTDNMEDDLVDDDFDRLNRCHSLEAICEFYISTVQTKAATVHRGGERNNRRYYQHYCETALIKHFTTLDGLRLKIIDAERNQDLFQIVSLLEAQKVELQAIEKLFIQLKQRFEIESQGIDKLTNDDIKKLAKTFGGTHDELCNNFLYRLNQAVMYRREVNKSEGVLNQLIKDSQVDLRDHHFSQLYNCLERLFIAYKIIASGIVTHSHKNKLGQAGALMQMISGALKGIPLVGSTVSSIVGSAGKAAVKIDYDRTVNTLKSFDQLFAVDTLKYLAYHLSQELVTRHYHQLPHILGAVDNHLAKGKRWVLAEQSPNVFTRVSEYFCSRIFIALLTSEVLKNELQKKCDDVNFSGHNMEFIQQIGELIIDDIAHYQMDVGDKLSQVLLKTCMVTWQEAGNSQSLYDIFGRARVKAYSPRGTVKSYQHVKSEAEDMNKFRFIQSTQHRAEHTRKNSLKDITNPNDPVIARVVYNPVFTGNMISFPAIYMQIRTQQETIKKQQTQIEDLLTRMDAIEERVELQGDKVMVEDGDSHDDQEKEGHNNIG